MKRWRKYIFLLAAIVIAAVGGGILYQVLAIQSAECVVRVNYNGLENMYHVPYEYYAVNQSSSVKIPDWAAAQVLNDEIEKNSIYDDTATSYWFCSLEYAEDDADFDPGDYLQVSFGKNYRLYYHAWTSNTTMPAEEDLSVMQQAAETLCRPDLEEWSWKQGELTGLSSFMLIRHDTDYLVEQDDRTLLWVQGNGKFQTVMECPDSGIFDYFYFTEK